MGYNKKKVKKRNMDDYLFCAIFVLKVILNLLVGSFHEDLEEDPGLGLTLKTLS